VAGVAAKERSSVALFFDWRYLLRLIFLSVAGVAVLFPATPATPISTPATPARNAETSSRASSATPATPATPFFARKRTREEKAFFLEGKTGYRIR
jgi:hypothetical protein